MTLTPEHLYLHPETLEVDSASWCKDGTALTSDEAITLRDNLNRALDHNYSYHPDGDGWGQAVCSCGWRSYDTPTSDAYQVWREHRRTV